MCWLRGPSDKYAFENTFQEAPKYQSEFVACSLKTKVGTILKSERVILLNHESAPRTKLFFGSSVPALGACKHFRDLLVPIRTL